MFSSSLRALLLLLATVQLSAALPATPSYKTHTTHSTRSINGLDIKTFHPTSSFEVYDSGLARRSFSSKINATSFRDAGRQFMRQKFDLPDDIDDDDMDIDGELDGHMSHVWFRQRYAGIPIANTRANVVMSQRGDIVTFSSSFVKVPKPSVGGSFFVGAGPAVKATPKLTSDEAIRSASKALNGRVDARVAPALEFLVTEDGSLQLTHSLRMHADGGHVVQAYVNAEDGNVIGLVDYTAELGMRVVPVTSQDPNDGGVRFLKDVEDKMSSPRGWTNTGDQSYKSTAGNNVLAAKGDPTTLSVDELLNHTARMTGDGVFDYTFDPKADPSSANQVAAATVNAWYVANRAHDILYRYGFTEKAFNFQDDNMGKGGKDADVVFLSVQDASGTNNANFVTLPDGQPGLMRMYLWDAFQPQRDGDFTNSIVLHEYTHGLSNRLVGGGSAQCLQSPESRGLGEGWSDAFAEWVWQSDHTHVADFPIGSYIAGKTQGIRDYPYSGNRAVNPLTYAKVKDSNEEHTIGMVWAQALHNVLATLVRQLGPSTDALTNPDGGKGHAVFLRLFVDSLTLTPCNPSFTQARTAWLQADQNRYQGKHKCALWLAFSYIGLGDGAADYRNSVKIPKECSGFKL